MATRLLAWLRWLFQPVPTHCPITGQRYEVSPDGGAGAYCPKCKAIVVPGSCALRGVGIKATSAPHSPERTGSGG